MICSSIANALTLNTKQQSFYNLTNDEIVMLDEVTDIAVGPGGVPDLAGKRVPKEFLTSKEEHGLREEYLYDFSEKKIEDWNSRGNSELYL